MKVPSSHRERRQTGALRFQCVGTLGERRKPVPISSRTLTTSHVDIDGRYDRSARALKRTRTRIKASCGELAGGISRTLKVLSLLARVCSVYLGQTAGCAWYRPSAVDFLAMTNSQNGHPSCFIVYFVDDSIVSDTNPPTWVVRKLPAAGRSRFVAQAIDLFLDGFVWFGVKRQQFFFSTRKYEKRVDHFRFRSIRAIASSKGTGVSPDTFASSYSRIASRSSSSSRIFSYSSMLMTTATFSPRSFTTNWRPLPMECSLSAVYSGVESRAIATNIACLKTLLLVKTFLPMAAGVGFERRGFC